MGKTMWTKLRSLFRRKTGKSHKERLNSLSSKLNVDEEYTEAFRTKSYVEMWSKAQGQLGRRRSIDRSSSLSLYVKLSDYLLEPQQETLMNMIKSLRFHHLLIDYFEASLEAYDICELLLRSVHQTRANYQKIQRVIKLTKKLNDCSVIFRQLSAVASLKNPLSIFGQVHFRDYHHSNIMLLSSLTSKGKKIRRRAICNKLFKKVGGYSLVILHSALTIGMLVFLLHSMVGVVAAPGLVAGCLVLIKRKTMLVHRRFKTSLLERLAAQLDVAAKGVFILINDFNTMSRMVKSLHDEVEHCEAIAKMCVRIGKPEILKEVVKEFQINQSKFLDQLNELEEHIYLCFLTINRSRRLVLQEIMVPQHNT
ncbi:UPF0496 protein At1g20180 isoform X2 [Pistacia vera]|uniref:UPF0496 protein At1g20180 isoform X2 n=1 Tax=Pistacia vera TaxID=55513 RepID=UPI001263C088|nr:UPF0496 protein At1g20180 isoform X2 [Pistacia vera]